MAFLAVYLGWAAVGKLVTGHSPYFFLDPDVVSSSLRIILHYAGFVALGPLGMNCSPDPAQHTTIGSNSEQMLQYLRSCMASSACVKRLPDEKATALSRQSLLGFERARVGSGGWLELCGDIES